MEAKGCFVNFVQTSTPYIAMIVLQFGHAGSSIITKIAFNQGMSHYVLVVYRHIFAIAVISPFAVFLERKVRPKLTLPVLLRISLLGLIGPGYSNCYYAGSKFTSPTFVCAMSNILPAMTFVIAVVFGMEKVGIKKVRCQAKLIGTFVTLAGAMVMTLYKGHVVNFFWSDHIRVHRYSIPKDRAGSPDKDRLKGSIILIIATLLWASFFILQAATLKKYPAQLSLVALICFMGTLQSAAFAVIIERNPSAWAVGWDMKLLSAAYAGIITSSITYYVQGLVMQKRGPVFATAFSPLMMIIGAVMSSIILGEKISVGSVIGAILIVAGLYSVLWGKYKENQEQEAEIRMIPKSTNGESSDHTAALSTAGKRQDIEAMENNEPINNTVSSSTDIAINRIPIPQSP